VRRGLAALAVLAALAGPQPAAAQLPAADSAFARGEYARARQLYESALARDSLDPRALYQLAVLDSWDGRLDRSLARLATLRRVKPADPDVMAEQAKVLSWANRLRRSAALYDSVLTISPDRLDALVGRARAVAWGGDLVRAERLWRDALKRHPDEPDILAGLAQTLDWRGEPFLAEGYAARARQLAPDDRTIQELNDRLRAKRGPVVEVSGNAADDIDDNAFIAVSGALSVSPSARSDLRGTLVATWRRNDEGARTAGARTSRSSGLDASLVRSLLSGASLRAGVGVRLLDPDTGAGTSRVTAQLGAVFHPGPTVSVNAGYRRYPFEETTTLVEHGFVWDELSMDAVLVPRSTLTISASANAAWLSDGNRRLIGAAGVTTEVVRRLRAGVYARLMGFREPNAGRGYFSPDRFALGEGQAAYTWWRGGWWVRAAAGLGAQQVGSGGATQAEWHTDVTVAYSWQAVDQLAAVATYTNSATARTANATTPTYRYWNVSLRYRRGL
jgi:tetratricopeptide (TPR) repeat protein